MTLESLIHAQLEGEITPDQHAELEARLRADWQARKLYLELADQHARLLHHPEVTTGRLHPASPPIKPTQPSHRPWLHLARYPLAIAALIALTAAATLFFSQPTLPQESTTTGVAILTQTLDAQFQGASPLPNSILAPGHFHLTRGLAQIEFFCGASLLIEGGTHLEILSPWEARCHSGRLRAHVPPAAKGFLLHTPTLKVEDLGTEFALNVSPEDTALHVFEGEVIAHPPNAAATSLTEGMSYRGHAPASPPNPQDFLPIADLRTQLQSHAAERFAAWQSWHQQHRSDPRLIACYALHKNPDDRWNRRVPNDVRPVHTAHNGAAVGARWTQGRWPQKDALEFRNPGDRIRLKLEGTYTALTLACWVKVDSVDKKYSGLLLTDGYDNGEPHWQIYEDGSLMFSLMYRPADPPVKPQQRGKWNQMYFSKPVFTAANLGRWHHIAVTYDNQSGEVIQYFDGREVSREVHSLHQPDRPLSFGPCEIGNWGLPTEGHQFPIRNLNGAIDEFAIYSTALSATEIQSFYRKGQPE